MAATKKRSGTKKKGAKKGGAKRGAAKKGGAKRVAGRKGPARKVVLVSGVKRSVLAIRAEAVFDRGVQEQLRRMAQHGIPTVVYVEGKIVRAVPRLVGGRYVVREEPAGN